MLFLFRFSVLHPSRLSPFNRFIDFSASSLVGEATAEPLGEFAVATGEEGDAAGLMLLAEDEREVEEVERLLGTALRGSLLMRLLKKSANTLCSFCCEPLWPLGVPGTAPSALTDFIGVRGLRSTSAGLLPLPIGVSAEAAWATN